MSYTSDHRPSHWEKDGIASRARRLSFPTTTDSLPCTVIHEFVKEISLEYILAVGLACTASSLMLNNLAKDDFIFLSFVWRRISNGEEVEPAEYG